MAVEPSGRERLWRARSLVQGRHPRHSQPGSDSGILTCGPCRPTEPSGIVLHRREEYGGGVGAETQRERPLVDPGIHDACAGVEQRIPIDLHASRQREAGHVREVGEIVIKGAGVAQLGGGAVAIESLASLWKLVGDMVIFRL